MAPNLFTIKEALWKKTDRGVVIVCPWCNRKYLANHSVDEDGIVTPSLDCPTKDCKFHEFVILQNWKK